MADPAEIEMLRQMLLQEAPMPQRVPRPGDPGLPPPTPPPYPLQPNGLPDLSGVPAFGERGFQEGLRTFGPELALDAASIAAPGVGRAIAAAPKTAGAIAGALGIGTPSAVGEPAKTDPRVLKLQEIEREIKANRAQLEKQATTNFQSTTARNNAAAPYLTAIQNAETRKREIEGELDAEQKALQNSSFARAHPDLNAWWPAIQWGGPVAAAMVAKGAGNMAERAASAPWRRAVDKAERALEKGNAKQLAYQTGKAQQHLALEPQTRFQRGLQASDNFIRETAAPVAAGAGVGMEASLYPYQYDRRNAPEGSTERAAAEKALGEDFYSTAFKGLAPGVLGGFTGVHMPNIGPGYRPVAETKNLQNLLRQSGPPPLPTSPVPGAPAPPALPGPGAQGPLALPAPAVPAGGPPPIPGPQRPGASVSNQDLGAALKYPPGNTNAAPKPDKVTAKTGQVLYQDPDTKRFVSPPDKK